MTIRQYKKRYYLCKDSFGNKLYVNDTIEFYIPLSHNKPMTKKLKWNMVEGAWVEYDFFDKVTSYDLSYLLRQVKYKIPKYDDEDKETIHQGYVKKVKSFYTV